MTHRVHSFLLCMGFLACVAHNVTAQAVEKGDIIADVYVGGPNLLSAFVKLGAALDSTNTISSTGGLIPLGIKAEYMVSSRFGVGIDFNHANTGLNLHVLDTATVGTYYDIGLKMPRNRILATGNYHFGNGKKSDWYGTLGLGVILSTPKLSIGSNDPAINNPDVQAAIDQAKKRVGTGFSYRLALGWRYFFTPNIGLNLETGIGGPMLKGGISVKI